MFPVLPLDIIALIIDTVEETKDTNLLKELALVSHSFLQLCSKHLFATVELHNAFPSHHLASSKKGFAKLLKSRPDVVKHIRKLTYILSHNINDDRLLLPILLNFLPTYSRLNCLTIISDHLQNWNILDSSLVSTFLRLMHLPTVNHIDLSYIKNFPLSSLTPSVNLHRLDIYSMWLEEVGGSPEIELEMMPKIREFHTSESSLFTTKLLHAKRQDGQPAFNFADLRQLSTSLEDEQNIRYLLQNAKSLEKLHLSVGRFRDLVGLHDIILPSARTLKVFDLTLSIYSVPSPAGLCEELEAMAGHNMLEALSFEFQVNGHETEGFIGRMIQKVWGVLLKPGWSALKTGFL